MSEVFYWEFDKRRPVHMRRRFCVCMVFVALTLLGACAATRVQERTIAEAVVGEKALASHFSLSGRISVRVGEKVDSGSIRWVRAPDEERIGLYSPLGSQVAELVNDSRARIVTLRQGKEITTSRSVADLTGPLLGVELDLARMAEWTQGFGLRENDSTEVVLANGDLWHVTAERYQASGNYRFASRVNAIRGDVVVRMVIDEWRAL